ncbi:hypothetical protein DFH07DRAFT_28052 [Mycena maculata]|uniref:Uncharacterized protein n=1 Tax=Mycena maculata TaxID=230809 RepID=A0AAD7N3S3_9AGAR|nr:hypothetical protein DFH07DRAFT_28052 [Mycena maculata]
MTTPELKKILLIDCAWSSLTILSFVQRSGCDLQQLVLHGTRVRAPELIALLRLLTTLDTLVLTGSIPNALTDTLLEALTPIATPVSPLLVPAPYTIILSGVYVFGTHRLISMLEGRTTPHNHRCSPFTFVDLTFPAAKSLHLIFRGSPSCAASSFHGWCVLMKRRRLLNFDLADYAVRASFGLGVYYARSPPFTSEDRLFYRKSM